MNYQFYKHSQTPYPNQRTIMNKYNTNSNQIRQYTNSKEHSQMLTPIISHISSQKTDQDRFLYENNSSSSIEKRVTSTQYNLNKQDFAEQKRIDLAIMIIDQNQKMKQKITEIRKLIADQQLKTKIFKQNIVNNQKTIKQLRLKKEELQQNQQMMTLNESFIPNKSAELGSTLNTISWMNQFLNKDQLENLWLQNKHQTNRQHLKKSEPKIKSYTLDLCSFMASAKQKQQKSDRNIERQIKIDNFIQQKQDLKSKTTKDKKQSCSKQQTKYQPRINLKVDLNERTRLYPKNISQIRNLKRIKNNPEY